jgi:hypothetical protein
MTLGSKIVTVIKLKGMRLMGHIVHMGETRNICNIHVWEILIWRYLILFFFHIIYYTGFGVHTSNTWSLRDTAKRQN